MNLSLLVLFLHIGLMFTAVAASFGVELFLYIAYRTGQVGVVRGVGAAVMRVGPAIPMLFVLGGLAGLATALSFGVDLLVPWLVIAYVGFGLAMVNGLLTSRNLGRKLGPALATATDGPLTPEIQAIFTGREYVLGALFGVAIVFVLIFDMVVKPFS